MTLFYGQKKRQDQIGLANFLTKVYDDEEKGFIDHEWT